MAKKKKRLTKKERKALQGKPAGEQRHIHCIACGRHLDPQEFTSSPAGARTISCQHGGKFPVCTGCVAPGQQLLEEHDRSGQPVRTAQAWH